MSHLYQLPIWSAYPRVTNVRMCLRSVISICPIQICPNWESASGIRPSVIYQYKCGLPVQKQTLQSLAERCPLHKIYINRRSCFYKELWKYASKWWLTTSWNRYYKNQNQYIWGTPTQGPWSIKNCLRFCLREPPHFSHPRLAVWNHPASKSFPNFPSSHLLSSSDMWKLTKKVLWYY